MDEKRIYYCNCGVSKQWLGPQKNWDAPKVMLCVWWNFEDVSHWEFVPKGRSVDADLYSRQLE